MNNQTTRPHIAVYTWSLIALLAVLPACGSSDPNVGDDVGTGDTTDTETGGTDVEPLDDVIADDTTPGDVDTGIDISDTSPDDDSTPDTDATPDADDADVADVEPDVEPLLCGNGTLDDGEGCDDGNDDDADRCSNDCSVNLAQWCVECSDEVPCSDETEF